jgi:hypothetical protein
MQFEPPQNEFETALFLMRQFKPVSNPDLRRQGPVGNCIFAKSRRNKIEMAQKK